MKRTPRWIAIALTAALTAVFAAGLTFVPDDPSAQILGGHYTSTFSDPSNSPSLKFTSGGPFNVVAVAADGSRVVFNLIGRTTRAPHGTVTVTFDVTHFECVPPGA